MVELVVVVNDRVRLLTTMGRCAPTSQSGWQRLVTVRNISVAGAMSEIPDIGAAARWLACPIVGHEAVTM